MRWRLPLLACVLVLCLGGFSEARAGAGREGVGLQVVGLPDGNLVVVRVLPASPAQAAGFRPGDLLLSVNGRKLAGSDLAAVSKETLWGQAGARLTIRFLRPGVAGVHELTVTRGNLGADDERPIEVKMLQPPQEHAKEPVK